MIASSTFRTARVSPTLRAPGSAVPDGVRAALVVLLVALMGSAACTELPEGPPRTGDALPEFSGTTRDGGTLAFADLQGKPALINLWATWCPPCRSETPYLQLLQDELSPHGFEVVGVSLDTSGNADVVDDFLTSVGASYRQILDPEMTTMDLFNVLGLPATFIVDAEGVITHFDLGPVDDGDPTFAAALRALLPEGVRIPEPAEVEAESAP